MAAGVREGDRRSLARALTLVESRSRAGQDLVRSLSVHRGAAVVVGLTGAPGVGKSTLASTLVADVRAGGASVAVAAVDPSSPVGGGALLGDRLRLAEHWSDDGVFVRSFASQGQLGGLSAMIPACLSVMAAAPFDWLLLETVGVGQSEFEVCNLADVTVVVTAPGMGDGVQAEKAGLYELADVFVVNKADRPGADRAAADLRQMLTLGSHRDDGAWEVPVILVDSLSGTNAREVVRAVEQRMTWLRTSGGDQRQTRRHDEYALLQDVLVTVREQLASVSGRAVLERAADGLSAGGARDQALLEIFAHLYQRQSAASSTTATEKKGRGRHDTAAAA
jgi:LAO/AO transport system kinase